MLNKDTNNFDNFRKEPLLKFWIRLKAEHRTKFAQGCEVIEKEVDFCSILFCSDKLK